LHLFFWPVWQSQQMAGRGSTEIIQMTELDGTDREPQYVLQLDNWVTLTPKSRSGARYEEIQALVEKFDVSYEFLSLDSTGIGRGVADAFVEAGYKVRAISWEAALPIKNPAGGHALCR